MKARNIRPRCRMAAAPQFLTNSRTEGSGSGAQRVSSFIGGSFLRSGMYSRYRKPRIADELADLREVVLRHEDQIARPYVRVFAQIFPGDHALDIHPLRLQPPFRNTPEQQDLGVLGAVRVAARNGYRLGHGGVAAHLVLDGMRELRPCD